MKLRGLAAFSALLRASVALVTLCLFPASAFAQGPCPVTTGTTLNPVPLNLPFGGAVSCNNGGSHADNFYYRAFDLCRDYGITDFIDIRCITSAFSSASAGGGTQPVRIRLSLDLDGGAVGPLSSLTLFYEEEFQVPSNANQPFNFVLGTGIVDPDGILAGTASTLVGCLAIDQTLVVEIFTPDGSAGGHAFFMAIPDPAQTDPATDQIGSSFFAADECGLFEPSDTASLGFPDNMWIMDVAWDDAGDCVCSPFIRSDADADGATNLADAIAILDYLFIGGTIPCNDAADIDDDGALDLSDPIVLLGYLFSNTPAPPAPFPDCGIDPTPDALDCDSFAACP